MDCNEDILLYKSFVLDYSATSVPQNKALMGLTLYNCCGYINFTESECINHHIVCNRTEITEEHTLSIHNVKGWGNSEMRLVYGSCHFHSSTQ